jgi:hypothetical protein
MYEKSVDVIALAAIYQRSYMLQSISGLSAQHFVFNCYVAMVNSEEGPF